ncbi:hypothetical protein SAMN06265338_11235 [Rhodoblastus acidophilus]|uniref:O-antigen ligase n=1 Tax=Rhodoblastus acidophilus TaxID=1074 RepID=A0A212S415_RHOAC|nr:hypothetical protein [Rhodoblastus acidophilus]PPQ37700.1 hypothetical protein CKO16_12990 [Rhodoblastus acidophilus]RAI23912.1 hypothetical protein CH337_02280 [Rhodoblastus acidophilus]SNB79928.1 hypothetical protein SAMN06265338_11235 [Rhodoblastus acidophilus]
MAKPFINAADKTSADAAHLLMRLGLILGFVITPIVLLTSQRAIFILSPIAATLILSAGAMLSPRVMRIAAPFSFLASPVGLGAVFLSIWAVASLTWTPFPSEAAPRLFKIVSTFLLVLPVASVLPVRSRPANLYVLPLGVAAASFGAIALNFATPAAKHDVAMNETLARAVTVLLLLAWPATLAAILRGRPAMAASVAIVVAAAAVAVHATTASFAALAAGAAFLAAKADKTSTASWIGRIGAASFIAAPCLPLLLGPWIGDSSGNLAWLNAWRDTIMVDGVRLLTGHGFNYVASGSSQGYLGALTPKTVLFEIWTDLGILGALAGAALLAWAYQLAGRQSPKAAPYWIGALTFVTAFAVFGGGALQLGWITAQALALVALILATRGEFQTARPTAPRHHVPS